MDDIEEMKNFFVGILTNAREGSDKKGRVSPKTK